MVGFDYVPLNIRMYNFLIDIILWGMIAGTVEALFKLIIPENNDILSFIIYLITFLGYYGFTEYKYQKTLAKFITKTKVVTHNELKPNKIEILIRTLSRLIPIDPISFYVSTFGIHDRLSKTRVIKDNPNSVIDFDDLPF